MSQCIACFAFDTVEHVLTLVTFPGTEERYSETPSPIAPGRLHYWWRCRNCKTRWTLKNTGNSAWRLINPRVTKGPRG